MSEIEDLRGRVNELEATVRGLTQELVEANERIRVLEEEAEGADEAPANRHIPSEDAESSREKPTDSDEEEARETEDDIIVA